MSLLSFEGRWASRGRWAPAGRSAPAAGPRRALPVDLALLLALVLVGWSAVALDVPAGSLALLACATAVTAALLLVLAAATGRDRRAYLIACAVGPPALLMVLYPVGGERDRVWLMLVDLAAFGAAGLLAMAARGKPARGRDRMVALAALGVVLAAMAVVAVAGLLLPGWTPPAGAVLATGLLGGGCSGVAAALLVIVGVTERRSVLRRVGLAAGAGAVAQVLLLLVPEASGLSYALRLASGVMVLVAAVRSLQPAARPRVDGGRPPLPSLPSLSPPPSSPEVPGDRLDPAGAAAAVRAVAEDLAMLYRGIGQDVRIAVLGDPWVSADRAGLAQLLANLLANCVRHAPGARVTVHAAARGPRVRIEVIDDGPGLPPGSTARLLRRGVRGPGSTGAGLGLAICTELVQRYRGGFTVVSTPAGCTAVVELPAARRGAPVRSG